jgi:hypothetical protein
MPLARLHQLVDDHIIGETFGLLGEPRVNVLALNLALDAVKQPAASLRRRPCQLVQGMVLYCCRPENGIR